MDQPRHPGINIGRKLRLGLAVLTIGIGVLTFLLDGSSSPRRLSWSGFIGSAIAGLVCVWLLEAGGVRWPRVVLAVLVSGLVGWLIWARYDDIVPLYLLVLVSWAHLTGSRRDAVVTTALAALALVSTLAYEPTTWLTWTIGVVSLSAGTGAIVTQRRLLAELRAAQADLAREAASAERRRIAHELHDVIAHSLSVTMLHLTAARHVLQRDPVKAAEALQEAERVGRESLADIRRTVGLLAPRGDERGIEAPVPTAADIPALVDEYRSAGLEIALETDGDPLTVPPATGLALYRIAQEALANVARHAPGARASVTLALADPTVLRVRDSGASPGSSPAGRGSGLGLPGMRERVKLLNGSLTAAPEGDGWLVECVVPAPGEPKVSTERTTIDAPA